MNTKRDPKCHLLNDWKEQIAYIGNEQTSLQNQFDVLRNDFSDNSPRILALETGLNSLDGRVIITESDIVGATQRITAAEADIDRIDAELVNKTGDINALTNRVSGAEADIAAVDGRVTAIETGEILYSQLTMDADKDFGGKAIVNPGLVDGVDVGSHVHSGAAGSGAKINLANVEVTGDKNFGGVNLTNLGSVSGTDSLFYIKGLDGAILSFQGYSGNSGYAIDTNRPYIQLNKSTRIVGDFFPTITGEKHLGLFANKWLNGYFSGDLYVDGKVDGVDVSEHVHDGTAVGGKKVSLVDMRAINTKNDSIYAGDDNSDVLKYCGAKRKIDGVLSISRIYTDGDRAYLQYVKDGAEKGKIFIDQSGYVSTLGDLGLRVRTKANNANAPIECSGITASSVTSAGAITGSKVSATGAITQNNGMPVASCPTTFSKNLTNHNFAAGSQSVDLGILPSNRSGLSLLYVSSNLSNLVGDCSVTIKLEYDDGTQLSCMYSQDTTGTMQLEQASLMPYDDASAKKCIKKAIVAKAGTGTCTVNITATGLLY
jgi:hypothetical protein